MKIETTLLAAVAILCLACAVQAGQRHKRHHTSYIKHVERHTTAAPTYQLRSYWLPMYTRVTTVQAPAATKTTIIKEPVQVAPQAPPPVPQ